MTDKEDFAYVRKQKRWHRWMQIILGISLFVGLNYIASVHFSRKDYTLNRSFTLGPETIAYLNKLEKDVKIILTIPSESRNGQAAEIYDLITRLSKEYAYETRNQEVGRIEVEIVDPYKQLQKAREIATKYGAKQENAIIVVSGEHYRYIAGNDLFSFKGGDISGFKGEQVFTSAILDVTREDKEKVYFLTGHGEMRINDVDPIRGISQVVEILVANNIEVDTLEINLETEVPEDATCVVLPSPQTRFLPQEVEKLRKYAWDRNGRLVILLDPGQEHGLEGLLYDWGIQVDDMIVLDNSKDFQASSGDLIVRRYAEHPITQFLVDNQLPVVMGLSRPVRPDMGANQDQRRATLALAASSETSWGEWSYRSTETEAQMDLDRDIAGPVPIATLSERSISSQLGINIAGGRVVVFGNADFLSNKRIDALGNRILVQNTFNWIMDRNEQLNIPPRQLKRYQITMSRKEMIQVGLSLLVFPSGICCLGLFIYTIRRR